MHKTVEQFHLFRVHVFQDHQSFEKLLREVEPRIRGFLKVKLPRLQDAEDAYSEMCLNLWSYTTRTKIDNFAAVAYTIARTLVADFYRKKGRRVTEAHIDETYLQNIGSKKLEQDVINKMDVEYLKGVLEELSEDEAQVILMRYVDQLGLSEIAREMGKTENNTGVFLHRSIQKLRKIAKEKFKDV